MIKNINNKKLRYMQMKIKIIIIRVEVTKTASLRVLMAHQIQRI